MQNRSEKLLAFRRPSFNFCLSQSVLCLGSKTKIMGVLNVTPDSFSDGGFYYHPQNVKIATQRALRLQEEGADIIDVGGESSRPGAVPVSNKEEIKRILPVLKSLKKRITVPLSIDTYKLEVAHAALDQGVTLVNDIMGLRDNSSMAKLIARYKAGVVLMHMKGNPRNMQKNPRYDGTLKVIKNFLKKAVDFALSFGIRRSSIAIDPGFGFGKTTQQNMEILGELSFFSSLKMPILVGVSRKSFIGNVLGVPVLERLNGSLAAAARAVQEGAHILRVHDVLAHRQLVDFMDAVPPYRWRVR